MCLMTKCCVCLRRGILLFAGCVALAGTASAEVDFNRDVRPILSDICFKCHGPDEGQRVSELRLDITDGAFADLDGRRAIVPHDANASQLYRRIISKDPEFRMPPPDSGRVLTPQQIDVVRKWIADGATWQTHWAFVPPRHPELPVTSAPDWCRNEIDHFVLAKLERNGLHPSQKANRRSLIRRVTLDLTGLPPTPAEVEAFLSDSSPDAWERVVDRLLRSPRYGERMAIDWLDAARYADTSGYQNDGPREMWRWRDWVIGAFNSNLPFDHFTIEQLAGDLLPNATLSQHIATGFNRNHRGNAEGGIIPEEYQVEYVVDRVDTTATVWLGLTMGCARCHDHKYDPITQTDFYRVFAYFNNIPESGRAIKEGNSPPYIQAPTVRQQAALEELSYKVDAARRRVVELQPQLQQQQAAWEQSLTGEISKDWTITDGLSSRFRLDGDLSDSVQNGDQVGSDTESDGRPVFRPGQDHESAHFDGTGSVEVGDAGNYGYFDKFSIGAWIRPTQPTGTIVSRMVHVDQGSGYSIHLQDGHLQVNLVKRWLDDSIRVQSRNVLGLNDWQHLTVTYDGSRVAGGIHVYLDGKPLELDVLLDGINQTFAVDEPFRIGGGHANYSGDIDDVHVYDRVLTDEEVTVVAVSESVAEIVESDPTTRTIGQLRKLTRYFLERHASKDIRAAHQTLVSTRRERDRFDESIPTVMVMQDMQTPRTTYVLDRGRYDAPTEPVLPGTPDVLPPMPDGAPNNRLGFAQWIVSPNHPLTARVAVNRIWQMYFGIGLVKTTEDFGAQGDMPSHPQLLDWLALEFIRSGWDLKALHKLIVTSATYQQDSNFSADLRERDPDNRLLARGPRFRLPAEVVRDQALLISGLLTETVGGRSVRPYQPEGLWREIASTTHYEQSHGADLYRRSLYTYWKRTVAPPTMVTLDATSRESCIVKRSRTNTPLQALALMNDVTFVEAARVLAQNLLQRTDLATEDRIVRAFTLATSRPPTEAEQVVLMNGLTTYRAAYQRNAQAAEELVSAGESPRADNLDVTEFAAWTTIVSVIMNLDEVITKE